MKEKIVSWIVAKIHEILRIPPAYKQEFFISFMGPDKPSDDQVFQALGAVNNKIKKAKKASRSKKRGR